MGTEHRYILGGFWNSWLHFAPRKYAIMLVSVADNLLNLEWFLR